MIELLDFFHFQVNKPPCLYRRRNKETAKPDTLQPANSITLRFPEPSNLPVLTLHQHHVVPPVGLAITLFRVLALLNIRELLDPVFQQNAFQHFIQPVL